MAPARRNTRSVEDVRRDLEREREQLATAAKSLRKRVNAVAALRSKLPIVALAGFLLGGGMRATARRLLRRTVGDG